jgi:hypothetical protein
MNSITHLEVSWNGRQLAVFFDCQTAFNYYVTYPFNWDNKGMFYYSYEDVLSAGIKNLFREVQDV